MFRLAVFPRILQRNALAQAALDWTLDWTLLS